MECKIINTTPYAGVDIIFKISWQWRFKATADELAELVARNPKAEAMQVAELYAVTVYQGSYAKSALQLGASHMKALRKAIDEIEMGTRMQPAQEAFEF